MTRLGSALLLALVVVAFAGCEDDDEPTQAVDPAAAPTLEFTQTGGCGDAFFWATTADDEHAVVVTTELRDRSDTEPTELDVALPDRQVEVELWQGTGLTSLMCNDIVDGKVSAKTRVVEGDVHITLEPRRGEDFARYVDGKAELSGLSTEDGTDLPDLAIKTSSIGFYAG